ncbi:MarR family winged helix-turn-helix transcriptional regulator [Streptomyces sp. NBC_00154]|uniref:MarR family winged helix-turn-helix transcriptional regulator n=1 Tax=Streptomyces sp. NBC_00154 TaxID=2975670 RepID=UPI00225A4D39|nr:MarR family transcriptional regulator [Streptomyces sp. NBC_00154]MCX5315343.1 MarR family transcriptional regulator [Streptomyces sp. NBC_00154]
MPHDEQPLHPLDQTEEMLVRALGNVMTALPRLVDADMVRDGGLPLSEYTPLMFLSEAPHRRMRMSELAAACNLSLSGMTRVVNRLEKQGLIQRAKCQEDLRGWNAVLTEDGFARLREAWPAHLASVRRHVLDNLVGHDLAALAAALQRVATAT